MEDKESKQGKMGISEKIRGGLEESWRSLSKIEAEGEKVVRGLVALAEQYGLDAGTKSVQDVGRDIRAFLNQLNDTIEQSAHRAFQGLNLPTREDLDLYNRKVKNLIDEHVTARLEKLRVPTGRDLDSMAKMLMGNMEEQVRKGLERFDLASRKDVETLAKDLKKLRQNVAELRKADVPKKTETTPAKAATKKAGSKKGKPAGKKSGT